MARTLTNIAPVLYSALDVVSREMVGLIPAVTLDAQASRAALNQSIYSPATASQSAADITPANYPPDAGENTLTGVALTISKSRKTAVTINGEQQLTLNNAPGIGWNQILVQEFAQAMRTLTNEVEADLAALYKKASRAYGTAGTTPFATAGDLSDLASVRQILMDNGAPVGNLQCVLGTAAGAVFRGKQASAQVQGDRALYEQGVIGTVLGMQVRESGQILSHTKGTAASSTTNNAGYAVGSTSLTLASAGTGTLVAGDVVTFAGDTANKYVVTTGDTDVSDGGTLVLGAPGIRVAMSAATKAITVGSNYAANLAFARSAIVLATRAPASPTEGDMAVDSMIITDPLSGLSFEVRQYPGYRRVMFEIGLAWGVAAVKPEHMAILLG